MSSSTQQPFRDALATFNECAFSAVANLNQRYHTHMLWLKDVASQQQSFDPSATKLLFDVNVSSSSAFDKSVDASASTTLARAHTFSSMPDHKTSTYYTPMKQAAPKRMAVEQFTVAAREVLPRSARRPVRAQTTLATVTPAPDVVAAAVHVDVDAEPTSLTTDNRRQSVAASPPLTRTRRGRASTLVSAQPPVAVVAAAAAAAVEQPSPPLTRRRASTLVNAKAPVLDVATTIAAAPEDNDADDESDERSPSPRRKTRSSVASKPRASRPVTRRSSVVAAAAAEVAPEPVVESDDEDEESDDEPVKLIDMKKSTASRRQTRSSIAAVEVEAEVEPAARKSSLTLHALRRVARPALLTTDARRITRQSLVAADAVEEKSDEPVAAENSDVDDDDVSESEEAPKRVPSRRSSRRSSAVSAPEPAAPVAAPQTRQVTVAKQTPFGVLMETKTIVVDVDGNEIKPVAAPAKRKAPVRRSSRLSSASDVSDVSDVESDVSTAVVDNASDEDDKRSSRRLTRTVSDTEATASTSRATRSSRRLTRTLSQANDADAVVAAVVEEPAPKRRAPTRRTTRASMLVDQSDADDGHVSEPVASRRLTRSTSRVISEDEADTAVVTPVEAPPVETVVVAQVEPQKRALRGRAPVAAAEPEPVAVAPIEEPAPVEAAPKEDVRRRVRGVVGMFEAVAAAAKQPAAAAAPATTRAVGRRRGAAEPKQEAPVVVAEPVVVAPVVEAVPVAVEQPVVVAAAPTRVRRNLRSAVDAVVEPVAEPVAEPVVVEAKAPEPVEQEPRRARRGASRTANIVAAAAAEATAAPVQPARRTRSAMTAESESIVVDAPRATRSQQAIAVAPVAAAAPKRAAAARPVRGRGARRRVSDEGDAVTNDADAATDTDGDVEPEAVVELVPVANSTNAPVAASPEVVMISKMDALHDTDDEGNDTCVDSPVRLIDMSSARAPAPVPIVAAVASEPVAVAAPVPTAVMASPPIPTPAKPSSSLSNATMAVLSATSSVSRAKPVSMLAILKQRLHAQGINVEDAGTPLRHPTKDRAKPAGRRPPSRPASRTASPVRSSPAPIAVPAAAVPASPAPVRVAEPVVPAAAPVDVDDEPAPLALDEDDGDVEEVQFDIVPQDAALTESIAREEVLPVTAVPIASAPAMFETALPDGAPVRASIADDVEFHSAAVQMLVTADVAPTRKRKSSGEATDAIERAAADDAVANDDDEAQLVDDDEDEDDDNDDDNVQAESGGAKAAQGKPVVKRARAAGEAESADPVAAAALRTADERVRLAREKRAALERARADEQSRRDEVRKMRDERRRREAEEAERTKNEMKEQRRQRLEAKIRRKREEREQAMAERSESTVAPSAAAAPVAAAAVVRKMAGPLAAATSIAAAPVSQPAPQPIAQAAPVQQAPQMPISAMAAPDASISASMATPMVRKGPMALFGKLFGALGSPQATHASDKATATTVASAAAIVAASSPVRRAGPASAAAWATSAHTGAAAAQPPQSKPVRDLTITAMPQQAAPVPSSSSNTAATGLMPPPTNYIRSPPPVNAASPRTLAAVANGGAKVSPAPESYLMSDCSEESDSAMSPETPEKRGKKVPLWAKRDALFRALQTQNVDPDEIFQDMAPPDLEEIFGAQRARYRRRASSANWTVDGLTTSENANFKRKMGFAPIAQGAVPLQPHRFASAMQNENR